MGFRNIIAWIEIRGGFLLGRLLPAVRQNFLWHSVHATNPRSVLRWLRAGADPNAPGQPGQSMFSAHLPIQEAMVRASRSQWSRPSRLVIRLLLRHGARPDLYASDGQLSSVGRALLTAGVPGWLLLHCDNPETLSFRLDSLLAVWSARRSRASSQELCRLLRLRASVSTDPPVSWSLRVLFRQAELPVIREFSRLFVFLPAAAVLGAMDRQHPLEEDLAVLFRHGEVEWDIAEKQAVSERRQWIARASCRHRALRDEQFMEQSTAPATGHRPYRRL